ncbi:MAG: hypothetical protein E7568_00505 [Ruminococcaceae bacterium]|nr:hypothetical protein [Oscillospiraceae bacterium]
MAFDDVMKKLGEVADVVASTTEKTVNIGKQKYNVAVLENKLKKCYEELGKVYYNEAVNNPEISGEIKEVIDRINGLIIDIETAKAEIENLR